MVVTTKYTQLLEVGVFEWMDKLPASKKAIESHIIFKEKLDKHSNHIVIRRGCGQTLVGLGLG